MRLLSTLRDIFWGSTTTAPAIGSLASAEALLEDRNRIERIQEAWRVYESGGRKPLAVVAGQPDDNTVVNYCRVMVDMGAHFLFSKGVEFDVVGDRTPDEQWLADAWAANNGELLLHDLAINGGVCGDAFVKIVRDPTREYPRLINLDPANVRALWDQDDIDHVVEYRIEWLGIDPATGTSILRRQTVSEQAPTWLITDWIMTQSDVDYREIGREVWPYKWCPIFSTKNLPAPNEFYGTPDLTQDVIYLNDRINFIASNTTRIIRHHAHPKTWGRGFSNQQVDMSPETITIIHSQDGMLQNLEMQSDLQSSLNWYKYLVSAMHAVARVPEVATGRVESLGQLSGVALEMLYGPIVEKTRTKRMLYGRMLNSINEAMLEMHGTSGQCTCRWADPWPVDNLTQAQIGLLYDRLGVSRHSIMDMLGFDYAREERQRATEQPVEGGVEHNADTGGVASVRSAIADLRPSRVARDTFTGASDSGSMPNGGQ